MGEPLGTAPRPRRLQVLTVTGYSSLPSRFVGIVLFVVDLVLGFRLAPNRVGAASTRRSGLRSHASQLRTGAMGTRSGVNRSIRWRTC